MAIDESYQEITGTDDPVLKRAYWETAKGLQAVDDLRTSAYLDTLVEESINNSISTPGIIEKLRIYYNNSDSDESAQEADFVATRIEYLLEQQDSFVFSPLTLKYIHRELFKDLLPFDWVGAFRETNIAKAEDILYGMSVAYAPYPQIFEQLEYDFEKENKAHYSYPLSAEQVVNLAEFASNIWETHPFREGNTRTIAVFLIQYLNNLGYQVSNQPFKDHSKYLRDAFVRSVYENKRYGIDVDNTYLVNFFENVLLDTSHDLLPEELYCHQLEDANSSQEGSMQTLADAMRDAGFTLSKDEQNGS